jgi:hypothetical protein
MSLTAHGHPSSKTHYIPLKNDNQDKPTTAQRGKAKDNASGQPVEQGTGQTSKRTIYNTLRTSFMDFGKTIDRACTRVENFMRHITRDDRRARYVLRKICNDLQDLYKDDPGAVLWAASDKRRTYKKHVVAIGTAQELELRKKPADSNKHDADSNKHDVDDKLDIGIHSFKNKILSKKQINNIENAINDILVEKAIKEPNNIKDWNAVFYKYCNKLVNKYGEADAIKIFNKAKVNTPLSYNPNFTKLTPENGAECFKKFKTSESDLNNNKDLYLYGSSQLKLAADNVIKASKPPLSKNITAKEIYHKMVNEDILNHAKKNNNNVRQMVIAHRWANDAFRTLDINPPPVEYGDYNNKDLIKDSNKKYDEISGDDLERLHDKYNKFIKSPQLYPFESCF